MKYCIKIIILFVSLSLIVPISSAVGPIPDTTETYPSWSPDGQKILFDSTGVMSEGVFLIKPDGSEIREIQEISGGIDPSWSHNGTKVILIMAFSNGTDSSIEIALLDIETGNITRLTFNDFRENVPKFSPDGDKIVFESYDTYIYTMNSDGTNLKKVAELARFPQWSPDGEKIVYRYYESNSIWVVDPDGFNKKKLFDDYRYSISSNFRWAHDSKYLLLNNGSNTITKVNIDDPTDIEYIYDPVAHWDPEYSPDGKYVTFVSSMDGGNSDLFVARSNGSDLYRIVFDTNPRFLNATPDYFYKKSRPAPPPWPTPSPTPEPTATQTPAVTSIATSTASSPPAVPGFSLFVALVALTSLVLINRRR